MVNIKEISSGLRLEDDGIWYSQEKADISYPTEGNENCSSIEEDSFWFNHRNRCISSIVQSFPPENNGTIFDIGGGNGYVSLSLVKNGFNVVLVEPGHYGVSNAKDKGVQNIICASLETAQFDKKSLPAVGLFDVAERIKDDLTFLKTINSLLINGGRLYMTVPSYSLLWSTDDDFADHYRRYTLGSISKTLELANFNISFSSYIFRFLPIPIFLFRTIPYKPGGTKENKDRTKIKREHSVSNGLVF